jgi:23S rRNA pseudouridine2605 synthase
MKFRKNKSNKNYKTNAKSNTISIRETDQIRLNKYIANSGVCSRREADTLIESGAVKVNGKTITELGTKIKPTDIVEYGGQKITNEKLVYLLLNKPKDYITTMDDPEGRRTVLDLVRNACRERIYPVGRLDRNTTGLLLFTNDGELTKKLIHPKYNVKKLYNVTLDRKLNQIDLQKIKEGVEIEENIIKVDDVAYLEDEHDKKEIGIELHSGQNRIVRKIFESLGYKVVKLDRISFAGLTKKNLPRGRWRFLLPKEIAFLKMGNFK